MKQAIGQGLVVAALACASGGCASDQLNIGDGKRPTGELGASLSDYAGRWEGHAEAYEFDDGSDRIRLVLDDEGNGAIEVGDSPALPEPDPEVGYPPGEEWGDAAKPIATDVGFHGFYSGFEYSIEGAQVESKRIRFKAATLEVFREWCEQQEPTFNVGSTPGEPTYSCAGAQNGFAAMSDPVTGEWMCLVGEEMEPVDCGRLSVCMGGCSCDADSCTNNQGLDVQLDAELESEGEELEGTLLIRGERIIVRMTRD